MKGLINLGRVIRHAFLFTYRFVILKKIINTIMAKIIVSEFITLDGVMEGPGPDDPFKLAGWTIPYVSEGFLNFKLEEALAAGSLLVGRITYEGFAKAWPGRTDEAGFADKFNNMPKYVVSATLQNPEWNNSHLVNGNVIEEIKKLKSEQAQDILVAGSSVLTDTLLKNNLVDELRLLVYPVVLGEGKRLFKNGTQIKFNSLETQQFDKGVVLLTYKI